MAKVLVVDDRDINRKLVSAVLVREGYRVIEASDGSEALELTRSEKPDLVITDLLMPTMDGYDLVRQIRQDPAIANTRVIFQTAHYLDDETQSLSAACGVLFVITKPTPSDEIIRTVKSALATEPPAKALPPADFLDREHFRVLTDKLAQKVDELHVLNVRQADLIELSVNLASERDPVLLLRSFAHGARRIFNAAWSTVGVASHSYGKPDYFFCVGPDYENEANTDFALDPGGVVSRLFSTHLPVRIVNAALERASIGLPPSESRITCFLGVPILSDNRVYGWLGLAGKTEGNRFSPDDERLAAVFASQVGHIYENRRLTSIIQQHATELEREVDERRRIEAALRDNEQRMQQVLAASPAAIFTMRVEGSKSVPAWISRNITRLAGYGVDDALQADWWTERIHPEDLDRAVSNVGGVPATDEITCEYRFRHRDASYRWIQDQRRVLRDEAGNVLEIVGSWVDITDKKILEGQLLQAQKMEAVGRLAGGVAHDFNNVLTAILGYSQLMMSQLEEDSVFRSQLTEVQRAGERAADLTRQLLLFSRKQTRRPSLVDLNTVIREMEKMLGRLIGEDVKLQATLQSGLGTVKADPSQIEQVLMNLVVNARDAMPKGGNLLIATTNSSLDETYARSHANPSPGDYVVITVTDTGTGMDPETQTHIFEPFFTTKEQGKGTGLGLSTAYGIIKQNGGHISVYSELGYGTTFKIYLPRLEAQAVDARTSEEPETLPVGTETILLAEDEPFVRQLAAIVLRERGYKVIECENGRDALHIIRDLPALKIDLLLTDVVMPEMGGVALAEWFASNSPETRVLFVSAYPDEAISHHGVSDTANRFLQKPFTPSSLARKVREVLDAEAGRSLGGAL